MYRRAQQSLTRTATVRSRSVVPCVRIAPGRRCRPFLRVRSSESRSEQTSTSTGQQVTTDVVATPPAAATAAANEATSKPISEPVSEKIPAEARTGSAATSSEANDLDTNRIDDKLAAPSVKSFPVELLEDDMFGSKGLVQELTDQKKFGKRGEAWFFAQMLVFLLILFPPMELKGLLDLVGTLAISAGLVFLTYALLCLGRSISPLPAPRNENKLVTTGMYGYVRHPMYGGLMLAALGLTLVTGSESRLALSLLLWWILEQKASVEEMLLEKLHPDYKAYKERVKKFIPYIY